MNKFYSEPSVDIYCGHVLNVLKSLPDESAQIAITSPPYWGLRNYSGGSEIVWGGDENCEHIWGGSEHHEHREEVKSGKTRTTERFYGEPSRKFNGDHQKHYSNVFCIKCSAWRGQLGLEPTPELYVEHLMMIFREVKRVLRKDGSFYLNIGDTYASTPAGNKENYRWQHGHKPEKDLGAQRIKFDKTLIAPAKCMVCILERVMFAMIEDEWILRNKIVWHKPNAMPSSVKDRFTTTFEMLYFFVKQKKYYFDLDAVREPHRTQSLERYQRGVNLDRPAIGKSAEVGPMQQYKRAPQWFQEMFPEDKDYKGKFDDMSEADWRAEAAKRGQLFDQPVAHQGGGNTGLNKYEAKIGTIQHREGMDGIVAPLHPKGKNPGDTIEQTSVRHKSWMSTPGHPYTHKATGKPQNPGDYWELTTQPYKGAHFAVFPEKLCERPIKASSRIGDVVLDPFAGSGTAGVVAKKLGRRAILIDCVENYCEIAKDRIVKIVYQPELEIK